MLKKIYRTFHFINQHPLARKNLIFAYKNFFLWQLQCLLSERYYIKPFIGNVKFLAKKGLTGITGNIYTGLHEFYDMGFLLHFLREQDTFFDIGANVGSYTLLASGYRKAKSFAFEPIPSTFKLLKKNIALNKIESITHIYNVGLGDKKGLIKFSSEYDTVNHAILDFTSSENTVDVELMTLDEFCSYNPALLKIDVEGFETNVIKGGTKTLENKNLKAIIIELNGSGKRYGYDEEKLRTYLNEIGFKAYSYCPYKRDFALKNTNISNNTIYIRDLQFVKDRCNSANKINLLGIEF